MVSGKVGSTKIPKIIELAKILPRRPGEALDRIATVIETKAENGHVEAGVYTPVTWEQLISELDQVLDRRCSMFADEEALKAVESAVEERKRQFMHQSPFATSHNGDLWLGRLCYIVARATTPRNVVETGVAYGVTSAFILQALSVNGKGQLHSVDLPPLAENADRYVGALIPEPIKERWYLHRGSSKRVLPKLLQGLGDVDIFVHDSLHTHKTMRWEFETVEPFLHRSAVVISDDVQGNSAFAEWSGHHQVQFSAVLEKRTKDSMIGISLGTPSNVSAPPR